MPLPDLDHEGPEIELTQLDTLGTALRNLLLLDLDKCHCTVEVFDAEPGITLVTREGVCLLPVHRVDIPLFPEPVSTEELARAFVLAAEACPPGPLHNRDLVASSRLVPVGSGMDGLEVPGLSFPVEVAEPAYLGQWIQNYSNHGFFLNTSSFARL